MKKGRDKQMGVMTLFAMILVVAGHSDITLDFKELWIFRWTYSFHMPLFFFISGFLFCLTNPAERLARTTYAAFMLKKAKRLLVPFLFVNCVIFIIKARFVGDTSMMQHPLAFSWSSYVDSTFFHPIGFMWFLPALFMIFAMVYAPWKKLLIDANLMGGGNRLIINLLTLTVLFMVIAPLCSSISFFRISQAIYYMPYFLIGISYCVKKEQIDAFILKYRYILIPISGILSMSLLMTGRMAAIAGIVFTTVAARIIADRFGERMVHWSGFAYQVFLLSYFPQMFIRGPVAQHWFPEVNQYVWSFISFIMGLGLPLLFCEIFTRIRGRSRLLSWCGRLIGL